MKRLLLATLFFSASALSATAADLAPRPYTKAPPMMVPEMNWSGFYIGAHVGGAWSETTGTLVDATPPLEVPIGTSASGRGSGVIGGGQVGVNWQTNHWVVGIEGDISGANLNDPSHQLTTLPPYPPGSFNDENVKIRWLATVTGRAGYAWNDSLLYVKGGAAFMDTTFTASTTTLGVGVVAVIPKSETRTGWTVGAGYEHAFMGNWSWKIEYDYLHFGTDRDSFFSPAVGVTTVLDLKTDIHEVKAGVNYRFNWAGPVVAKY